MLLDPKKVVKYKRILLAVEQEGQKKHKVNKREKWVILLQIYLCILFLLFEKLNSSDTSMKKVTSFLYSDPLYIKDVFRFTTKSAKY